MGVSEGREWRKEGGETSVCVCVVDVIGVDVSIFQNAGIKETVRSFV